MTDSQKVFEQARSGICWVFLTNGVKFILTFVVSVCLARLLEPRDFGIVAMAAIFFEISYVVGNFGMAGALVQRKELSRLQTDVAFLTSSVAGALLAAGFVLVAGPAAGFFGNKLVAPVMRIMAISVLFSAMSATAVALLERSLDFRKVGILAILHTVANGIVAVLLALEGFGPWSLAWGSAGAALVHVVCAHVLAGYRPRPRFDRSAFATLSEFGGSLTLKNVFVYLARNVDYFVVGKRLGEQALGFYTRAFTLMSFPQKEFVSQLNKIAFPAFSRIQDDPRKICEWFLRGARMIGFISIPGFFALATLAEDFTHVVYTDKWAPMSTALSILCIGGVFRLLYSLGGPLVESTGRMGYEVLIWLGNVVLLLASSYVGTFWGIEGVAIGVVLSSFAVYLARALLLRKLVALPLGDYFAIPVPPVLCAVAASGGVLVARQALGPSLNSGSFLVIGGALFAAIYLLFMWRFARRDYGFVFDEAWSWRDRLLRWARSGHVTEPNPSGMDE